MLTRNTITKIIKEWKADAHINHFVLFSYKRNILNIYTDMPGPMIGYHGTLVEKYTTIFKTYNPEITVNFVETDGIV